MCQKPIKPGKKYALPFFLVLALLTAVSLIVPLRPTFSYSEKRELAKFPAFSVDALLSGDYFDDMLDYMHDQMSDNVLKVDTVRKLQAHNGEYIYYRTDHHWSALGAYYAYQALCEAAGMEPVALEDMEYKNQGEMIGSIYGKVPYPKRLKKDELECWIPQGNITMYLSETTFSEFPMIRDVSNEKSEGKYCAFLAADAPIVHIVNDDIPDGPNCLVVKDSFGNCYVPYLSQNYHNVYAIDYRKYWKYSMADFARKFNIDDVIIAPYMIATQATDANKWFQAHFR